MKTLISTRIEANKDKIYRAVDVHDLGRLVFPNRNATDLSAAFILIFLSIKHSRCSCITTPELEKNRSIKAPGVSSKSLWKARATMARLGLIALRQGAWRFSSKFERSLTNLGAMTTRLMVPNGSSVQEDKEWFLLDCAIGLKKKH